MAERRDLSPEAGYDVAVLGGGPAGAATAIRLARFGFSVVVLDKGAGERHHVGESLPSSARVALAALGLDADLLSEALVARPPEHRVVWGELSTRDARRPPGEREASLLVWRGAFDERLLEAAAREGAVVLRGASVLRAARERSGFAIELDARPRVAARFVVDASGRAGVLSRASREREPRFRTLALTAHYRDEGALGPTLVEAFSEGWIWSAPLDDGRRDVTVMLDGSAAAGRAESLFDRALASSRAARELLAEAPRVGSVRGTDATPYVCGSSAGPDFAVVGDAASFLDPLAAHGVHKALDGALVAAAVVRTLLERPERVGDAVRFYQERERAIARVTAERLSRLYAREGRFPASAFWRKRSPSPGSTLGAPVLPPRPPLRGDMSLEAAPGARLQEAPVLEDDYVERREVLLAPDQERPVRFLGEVALPEVFRQTIAGPTVEAAARRLGLPFERALATIDWLYRAGYLEQRR